MRALEQEQYFRTLDRQVAVKIIDKSKMTDRELEILMREVGVLKLLDHPNIVRLYEIIEAEDTLYLIQEYCPGGEFYDSIVPHGMASLGVSGKDRSRHAVPKHGSVCSPRAAQESPKGWGFLAVPQPQNPGRALGTICTEN
jgi:serine/threonine protein kinase